MESEINKRAGQFAKYWRSVEPTELEDASDLIVEAIENELNSDGLSFDNKLKVVKQGIEIIRQQEPKSKLERLEDIWKIKNFFSKIGIDPVTGEEKIFWQKYELETYCKNEGVSIEEFVSWSIENKQNE